MSALVISGSVLIDLTWFISSPVRTGIQRYVYELTRNWPKDRPLVPVVVDEQARLWIIPFEIFELIEEYFTSDKPGQTEELAEQIKKFLNCKLSEVIIQKLEASAGIFLPEVTFNWDQISFYLKIVEKFPDKLFIMTYDFIPWLDRIFFRISIPRSMG